MNFVGFVAPLALFFGAKNAVIAIIVVVVIAATINVIGTVSRHFGVGSSRIGCSTHFSFVGCCHSKNWL